ncbi:MAG: hypothetical protein QM523_03820 [Candidatus Pacebacteria bacterium]|nr:hypothetical protein [Candidatus Paceibacterota bacterium]
MSVTPNNSSVNGLSKYEIDLLMGIDGEDILLPEGNDESKVHTAAEIKDFVQSYNPESLKSGD